MFFLKTLLLLNTDFSYDDASCNEILVYTDTLSNKNQILCITSDMKTDTRTRPLQQTWRSTRVEKVQRLL